MSFYMDNTQKNKLSFPPREEKKTNKNFIRKSAPKFPACTSKVKSGKRTAILTSLKKASFTVEAALIVPFFLLICLGIFSMLNFYSLYVSESIALKDKAEKTAAYAYEFGDTTDSDGYLTLTKQVKYKVPYSPIPLPALTVPCYARVHIWCGYLGAGIQPGNDFSGKMVYVTDYESVYHTKPSCTHLDLHIYTKSLSEAKKSRNIDGARYHPCEKCIQKSHTNQQVYLSEHGTAYHNTLECSGLKRNVRLVDQSQISDLSLCSRCESQGRR